MPTKFFVEWLDGTKADALYAKRRAAAVAKERLLFPDRSEEDIVGSKNQDGWWDWVDMDECLDRQSFPSLDAAKKWAIKNYKKDYFEQPRIHQNTWKPDESEREAKTVLTLEFQGGTEWLNTNTGETEK